MSNERYNDGGGRLIYVLAGSYEEARRFAHKNGYHYSLMVNVDKEEKLQGICDVTLYVTPSSSDRKNSTNLIDFAKTRRININYV